VSYSLKGLEGGEQVPSVFIDELKPSLINRNIVGDRVVRISLFEKNTQAPDMFKKDLQEEFLNRNFSVSALRLPVEIFF
jgi:hypothetical protein